MTRDIMNTWNELTKFFHIELINDAKQYGKTRNNRWLQRKGLLIGYIVR